MTNNPIVHITWPDGRPENVDASIHPHGPLRDVAEAVMSTAASYGHIVTPGARTLELDGWECRLEYLVLVELPATARSGAISMLWHHHFTFTREPWATEPHQVPITEAVTQ